MAAKYAKFNSILCYAVINLRINQSNRRHQFIYRSRVTYCVEVRIKVRRVVRMEVVLLDDEDLLWFHHSWATSWAIKLKDILPPGSGCKSAIKLSLWYDPLFEKGGTITIVNRTLWDVLKSYSWFSNLNPVLRPDKWSTNCFRQNFYILKNLC